MTDPTIPKQDPQKSILTPEEVADLQQQGSQELLSPTELDSLTESARIDTQRLSEDYYPALITGTLNRVADTTLFGLQSLWNLGVDAASVGGDLDRFRFDEPSGVYEIFGSMGLVPEGLRDRYDETLEEAKRVGGLRGDLADFGSVLNGAQDLFMLVHPAFAQGKVVATGSAFGRATTKRVLDGITKGNYSKQLQISDDLVKQLHAGGMLEAKVAQKLGTGQKVARALQGLDEAGLGIADFVGAATGFGLEASIFAGREEWKLPTLEDRVAAAWQTAALSPLMVGMAALGNRLQGFLAQPNLAATDRKALEQVQKWVQGSAARGSLSPRAARSVAAVFEGTGFSMMDSENWHLLSEWVNGDPKAGRDLFVSWLGTTGGMLMVKHGMKPENQRSWKAERPDLNNLDLRLDAQKVRSELTPQEADPALRAATNPLFRAGWEIVGDVRLATPEGKAPAEAGESALGLNARMRVPGVRGDVVIRRMAGTEDIQVEVPPGYQRSILGKAGKERLTLEGDAAREFLQDAANHSLAGKAMAAAALGGRWQETETGSGIYVDDNGRLATVTPDGRLLRSSLGKSGRDWEEVGPLNQTPAGDVPPEFAPVYKQWSDVALFLQSVGPLKLSTRRAMNASLFAAGYGDPGHPGVAALRRFMMELDPATLGPLNKAKIDALAMEMASLAAGTTNPTAAMQAALGISQLVDGPAPVLDHLSGERAQETEVTAVPALTGRGQRVLEALEGVEGPISMAELGTQLDISRSTLQRALREPALAERVLRVQEGQQVLVGLRETGRQEPTQAVTEEAPQPPVEVRVDPFEVRALRRGLEGTELGELLPTGKKGETVRMEREDAEILLMELGGRSEDLAFRIQEAGETAELTKARDRNAKMRSDLEQSLGESFQQVLEKRRRQARSELEEVADKTVEEVAASHLETQSANAFDLTPERIQASADRWRDASLSERRDRAFQFLVLAEHAGQRVEIGDVARMFHVEPGQARALQAQARSNTVGAMGGNLFRRVWDKAKPSELADLGATLARRYFEPEVTEVERQGGAKTGAEAREVFDKAREVGARLEGEILSELAAATGDLSGALLNPRKWKTVGNQIRNYKSLLELTKLTSTGGGMRDYVAKAAIEGRLSREELSEAAREHVDAMEKARKVTGRFIEEEVGSLLELSTPTEARIQALEAQGLPPAEAREVARFVPFATQESPRVVRMSTAVLHDLVRADGAVAKALYADVAKANNTTAEIVRGIYRQMAGAEDAGGRVTVESVMRSEAFEHQRVLDYMPSHYVHGGQTYELLRASPFEYMSGLVHRTAVRASFLDKIAQDVPASVREFFKRPELPTAEEFIQRAIKEGVKEADAVRLLQHMSGLPTSDPVLKDLATTPGGLAASKIGIGARDLWEIGKLVTATVPNISETLGTVAVHGGLGRMARAARDVFGSYRETVGAAERLGAMRRVWHDQVLSEGENIRAMTTFLRRTLNLPFIEMNRLNSLKSYATAGQALIDWKAGRALAHDRAVLSSLGFSEAQAKQLMSGKAPKELQDRYVRDFVKRMDASTASAGERSRAQNTRWFRSFFRFQSFFQNKMDQAVGAWRAMRSQDPDMRRSGRILMARYLVGNTAAGIVSQTLVRFLSSGFDEREILQVGKDMIANPLGFMAKSFAYGTFGGLSAAIGEVAVPWMASVTGIGGEQEPPDLVRTAGRLVWPLGLGQDFIEMTTGTGAYRKADTYLERIQVFLNRQAPFLKEDQWLGAMFDASQQQEIANSARAYFRIKRDVAPQFTKTLGQPVHRQEWQRKLENLMTAVENAMQPGEAGEVSEQVLQDDAVQNALTDLLEVKRGSSISSAIKQSRFFSGGAWSELVKTGQADEIRDRLADEHEEVLQQYDLVLEKIADGLRGKFKTTPTDRLQERLESSLRNARAGTRNAYSSVVTDVMDQSLRNVTESRNMWAAGPEFDRLVDSLADAPDDVMGEVFGPNMGRAFSGRSKESRRALIRSLLVRRLANSLRRRLKGF